MAFVCKSPLVSAIWCAPGAASDALPAGLPTVGFDRGGMLEDVIKMIVRIEGIGKSPCHRFPETFVKIGPSGPRFGGPFGRPFWSPKCPKHCNLQCFGTILLQFCSKTLFFTVFCGSAGVRGLGVGGCTGSVPSDRLGPDSARELGSEGVLGLGVGGCAGSMQK